MFKHILTSVICILTAIGLSGCGNSSVFQYINPEYKDQKLSSTSVLLLNFSDDLLPAKKKFKLLGKNHKKYHMFSYQEKKYFQTHFSTIFSRFVTTKVDGIDSQFKPKSIEFEYKEFKHPNSDDGFKMFSPIKGKIKYKEKEPKFVIFFEDLYFDKEMGAEGGGLGRCPESVVKISSGLKYLIWDNSSEQIVGYGSLKENFRTMIMPIKQDYFTVFKRYVKEIIQNSPFKEKNFLL
ncbi:MAG: hypothetical protein ACEPO8_03045 [Rhodothermaceae bacterium]